MGCETYEGGLHLRWEFNGSGHWEAINADGDVVGYLHLRTWGRHTHWSWRQTEDFDLSPGCLEEVRKKQKELFMYRHIDCRERGDL